MPGRRASRALELTASAASRNATSPRRRLGRGRPRSRSVGVRRAVRDRSRHPSSGPMLEAALVAGISPLGVDADLLGVLPTPGLAAVVSRRRMLPARSSPRATTASRTTASSSSSAAAASSRRARRRARSRAREHPRAASRAHRTARSRRRVTTTGRRRAQSGAYVDARGGRASTVVTSRACSIVVDCSATGPRRCSAPDPPRARCASSRSSTPSPTGPTSTPGADRPIRRATAGSGGRSRGAARDLPSTVTPTASSRSTTTGALVDGDQILAVSRDRSRRARRAPGDALATTVMSNLGLRHALDAHGIGWSRPRSATAT